MTTPNEVPLVLERTETFSPEAFKKILKLLERKFFFVSREEKNLSAVSLTYEITDYEEKPMYGICIIRRDLPISDFTIVERFNSWEAFQDKVEELLAREEEK